MNHPISLPRYPPSLAASLVLPLALASGAPAAGAVGPRGPASSTPALRISGPRTHSNLTVFLIRGRETGSRQASLTLHEATEQKQVVVQEAGNVNLLAIENCHHGARSSSTLVTSRRADGRTAWCRRT